MTQKKTIIDFVRECIADLAAVYELYKVIRRVRKLYAAREADQNNQLSEELKEIFENADNTGMLN
jgi:hypothetical protein